MHQKCEKKKLLKKLYIYIYIVFIPAWFKLTRTSIWLPWFQPKIIICTDFYYFFKSLCIKQTCEVLHIPKARVNETQRYPTLHTVHVKEAWRRLWSPQALAHRLRTVLLPCPEVTPTPKVFGRKRATCTHKRLPIIRGSLERSGEKLLSLTGKSKAE